MTKRIIGLVLALCLIVGLLPMIALAADPVESTLTVTTGTNDAKTQWKPTLSAGMAPAYAKTTAEGALVLEGATESDYNLKVEWPTDGKPTLTLNGATINNDTHHRSDSDPSVCHTITIGGTAAFEIVLKGTNTINGNHKDAITTTASHRAAAGIYASNTAALSIKSLDKTTDTLLIDNYGGNGIYKAYDALLIENANITIHLQNTAAPAGGSTNPHNGIVMAYTAAGYEDKTNLTVTGSILNIKGVGRYLGNNMIIMGKTASYNADNTGDILLKNSKVVLDRNNGSSTNGNNAEAIRFSPNGSFTVDRCDFEAEGAHRTFNHAPTFVNCTDVQNRDGWSTWSAYAFTPGAAITSNTNNSAFKATHVCGSATDDFDCTTPNTCDMCGQTIGGAAQPAHTPAADDGDCTTAVMCANTGCHQIATPALAAHNPAADDGDCTTAINCTVCGTELTPAKPTHTSPASRTSCDQAANCTECGTLIPAGQHTEGTPATCQAKATCSVCSQSYGDFGPHTGGTATCTEQAKCGLCGTSYGELAAHTEGTPATCKDKAVCSVCSQPYGELSTEHVPEADDGDCTTAVKCSVCGGEAVAAKTHTFTNSLDTACDNIGCGHTRVVEPKPDFKLSYATNAQNWGETGAGKAVLIMKAGEATKYFTTGQYDTSETFKNNWYLKELTDAAQIEAGNWNMKIEYAADGIPTVTMKNLKLLHSATEGSTVNSGGLLFGGWSAPYEGPTKVILEGDNMIDCGYARKSALNFNTKGENDDVTITSKDGGKLTIYSNTNSETSGGISATGNLILDNANITIYQAENYGKCQGIYVKGGDLTVKGGNLKIVAYDDSKTTHYPGKEDGYSMNQAAGLSALLVKKASKDATTGGNVIVEGGANVFIAYSVCKDVDKTDAEKRIVATEGTFTIKDSTVEIGLVGKTESGAKLFSTKPTLEFTNNSYTITATETKKPTVTPTAIEGYTYYWDIASMTPDETKLVDWDETTSLGSITYFKITTGGTGGSSGSTGSNGNDDTGDISVLLTAAVALSSAVGFAGVTVLRKKQG